MPGDVLEMLAHHVLEGIVCSFAFIVIDKLTKAVNPLPVFLPESVETTQLMDEPFAPLEQLEGPLVVGFLEHAV